MDEALRPLGLTTPQYGVLCALEAEPGMSNADLARGLFVTAQTMHGILTTLERDGLVRRGSDQTHGKRLTSELTRQGAGLLRRAHGEIGQVEKLLAAGLSDSEVERLVRELLGCAVRMGSR